MSRTKEANPNRAANEARHAKRMGRIALKHASRKRHGTFVARGSARAKRRHP